MSKQPSSRTPGQATVSLADEEAVKRILMETLFGLWTAANNLTRLRPSKRERYRVTIFGSARTKPGHWVYQEVKRMAEALASMGCDIVTGGGPGLMQAANEGAEAAKAPERVQNIGFALSCLSSKRSIRLSKRLSNIRHSLPVCITSCCCPTLLL